MTQRKINPWTWQDQIGFSQAIDVSGATQVLYCSGQTSMDADGKPAHVGDMRGQVTLALDNLDTVLAQAGYTLANVTRLNYYTTDVQALFGAFDIVRARLGAVGCQPSSTLLGVAALAFPELLVEIEATATK